MVMVTIFAPDVSLDNKICICGGGSVVLLLFKDVLTVAKQQGGSQSKHLLCSSVRVCVRDQ